MTLKVSPPVKIPPVPASRRFVDIMWRGAASSVTASASGILRGGGGVTQFSSADVDFLGAKQEAGTGLTVVDYNGQGVRVAKIIPAASYPWTGIGRLLPNLGAPMTAGFPGMEDWGLWRIIALLAWDNGAAGANENGLMVGFAGSTEAVSLQNTNNNMFGVGPGAAGGVVWRSKTTYGQAGWSEEVPLDWPGALSDFAKVELRIREATPAKDAELQVFINDVLQVTRKWSAGQLPKYNAAAPRVDQPMVPVFCAHETPLYILGARYIVGADVAGT